MIRSSLCNYSDGHILAEGTITVQTGQPQLQTLLTETTKKKAIFKNCAPFTDCISEIYNKEIYHAKNIDIVMPVYNLIEYSDNYSKTSGSLWQ